MNVDILACINCSRISENGEFGADLYSSLIFLPLCPIVPSYFYDVHIFADI